MSTEQDQKVKSSLRAMLDFGAVMARIKNKARAQPVVIEPRFSRYDILRQAIIEVLPKELNVRVQERYEDLLARNGAVWARHKLEDFDFVHALSVAKEVFEHYKIDHHRWWRRMDGTPILNDVAVRMAEAFRDAFAIHRSRFDGNSRES
jgi:hypothetical protein